jgi:tRNA (mo5U34)-methyltransferase
VTSSAPSPTGAGTRGIEAGDPLWYHTIELAPGKVTPGAFDLRPIVERMPWPDVHGKRCLDVGTYDGFLAFELERRGAAEVVCTDISDHAEWDWPANARADGPGRLAELAGEKGKGFEIAAHALGSNARKVEVSVYDLSPERVGHFDVVVCGSLMLHLRDPVRALEAIRSVCKEWFLSAEEVRLGLTRLHPRRAVAELDGTGPRCQWWVPNAAGHRRMLRSAGFHVERTARPYRIPFGPGHPRSAWRPSRRGVAHSAALARPAT